MVSRAPKHAHSKSAKVESANRAHKLRNKYPSTPTGGFRPKKDMPTFTRRSRATAFNTLPLELNQEIAYYFDDDIDIANYRLVCRATNNAIIGHNFSFWKIQYRKYYDLPANITNEEVKKKYEIQTKVLRRGLDIRFTRGNTDEEQKMVKVLKVLIIESFEGQKVTRFNKYGFPWCHNLQRIFRFVQFGTMVMNGRRAPPPGPGEPVIDPNFAMIKLMCVQLLFTEENLVATPWAFDECQKAVYQSKETEPLYHGRMANEVNMAWTLHCMTFFRYYIHDKHASGLPSNMKSLCSWERPSHWEGPLKYGRPTLNRYWKGIYAQLEDRDLDLIRRVSAPGIRTFGNVEPFTDQHIVDGNILDLRLHFPAKGSFQWPDEFENLLRSRRKTVDTEDPGDQNEEKTFFTGKGVDEGREFFLCGVLTPLPKQLGIPGWKRIKFVRRNEIPPSPTALWDLWSYEGVVLPGGRIILGRWWYAVYGGLVDEQTGPFMFWAVDGFDLTEDDDDTDLDTDSDVDYPDPWVAFYESDNDSYPSDDPYDGPCNIFPGPFPSSSETSKDPSEDPSDDSPEVHRRGLCLHEDYHHHQFSHMELGNKPPDDEDEDEITRMREQYKRHLVKFRGFGWHYENPRDKSLQCTDDIDWSIRD